MVQGVGFLTFFFVSMAMADSFSVQVGPNWTKEYIEREYFQLSPMSEFYNFVAEENMLNFASKIIYNMKDNVDPAIIARAANDCLSYTSTWDRIACVTLKTNEIGYHTSMVANLCRFMANTFSKIVSTMKLENVFVTHKSFYSSQQDGGRGHVVLNVIVRDVRGYTYSYAVDPDLIAVDGITVHPLSATAQRFRSNYGLILPRLD